MKSSSNQNHNPKSSSNRRSKETPSKPSQIFKNSVSSSDAFHIQIPPKMVAKCLDSTFSAATEDDLIDSSSVLAIGDGNPEKDFIQIAAKTANRSLSESSEQFDPLNFPLAVEIGGSGGVKTENAEIEAAISLLLGTRDRILNSSDVDARSKRVLEVLISSAIEPLDLLQQQPDLFCRRLQEKVWIGLVLFFAWIVSVLLVLFRDASTGSGFPGAVRPT